MSDISYAIISATAGSEGAELAFDTSIPDFVLQGGEVLQIALKVNKLNVVWSVQEVSGTFDGTVTIDDYGYSSSANSSLIQVANFSANLGYTGDTVFTVTATVGEQVITSNQFTVSGTGTNIEKEFSIILNESTLTGLDNSLQTLEVVVQRGALLFSQPQGQIEFTSTGTTSWTVPDGVTQISAVAIGGGGGGGIGGGAGGNLAYNTFTVTPGDILSINVGAGGTGINDDRQGQTNIPLPDRPTNGENSYIDTPTGCKVFAPGGVGATIVREIPLTGNDPSWRKAANSAATSGKPAEFAEAQTAGQTLNLGGSGGNYNPFGRYATSTIGNTFVNYSSAGGGAGGYAGQGGEGAPFTDTISGITGLNGRDADLNSGGGGGGSTFRGAGTYFIYNGAGGGVGLYGLSNTGFGGTFWNGNNLSSISGTGGSGGGNGTGLVTSEIGNNFGRGGLYGGGGAGIGESTLTWAARQNTILQDGGQGAIRIIWGENRAYPNTNTQDVTPITQEEVDTTLGLTNDTPAFQYTLINPLSTVSLPRTVTTKQFKRGQAKTSIPLLIEDDPEGTEGTNTGIFQLQVTDVTDGYQIDELLDTIDLTITSNPNPPVREISLDDLVSITIPEGDTILVPISRTATRNGVDDLGHSVTVSWQITTTSDKFISTSGSITIGVGENSASIQIPTDANFSQSDGSATGTFTITSVTSTLYNNYVIPTTSVDITLQDVVKTIEISNPTDSVIEITEGSNQTIDFLTTYTIDGVVQTNNATELVLSFSNVDSRLVLPETTLAIDEIGQIVISATETVGFQSSVDTIFKIESASDNYYIKPPISKIINVADNAVIVKQVYIETENIVAEEGDDITIVIKRLSTADNLDNYDDGGVNVPWRITGTDSRYSLTSGIAIFSNGDTEKTLVITTNDNSVGSADIVSTFEIYEPTNDYSVVLNSESITITLADNDPLYSITESTNFISEGGEVSFDISAIRVPDNTIVRAYINSETVTPSDFSGNVYKRNTVDYAGTSSSLTAEITTNPQNSAFDNAIASKGDLLVVGDCYASPAGVTAISGYTAGQVKVYRNISGTWTLEQTIVSPNSESGYFGWDVGVDDDRIVIGEYAWRFVHPTNPSLNENANGAAYIYKYNSTTEIWSLEQSLPTGRTSSNPGPTREGAAFGWSVAIENNFVVVGAPFDYQTYAGKIYVYKLDAGTWNFFDVEIGPYNNTFGDRIGYNIKLHNKIIVDGQVAASGQYTSPGEASIYLIGETELSKFNQGFESNKFNNGEQYGFDVAIYNNWSAVIWFDDSKLEIYNLADGAWTKTQVIDYNENIFHVEIFEDYMFVVGRTKDIFYENQSNSWVEIHSETTTQSGSLNRGRRQSQINNATKQIMKLDGSNVKLYTPQFNSSPVTILDNSATLTLTTLVDSALESGEIFNLELWSDVSPNGTLLASSGNITISDSTYNITTNKNSYNEDETISITVEADLDPNAEKTFTITGISETDVVSIGGTGLVSGSWSGNTYTGILRFSRELLPPLQQVYGGTGTQTWNFIVPDDISSISAVAVGAGGGGSGANPDQLRGGGGGALAYSNNIAVTPGETLTAEVVDGDMFLKRENGTVILKAEGGGRGSSNSGGQASNSVGTTKYSGAPGENYQLVFYANSRVNAAGGGAAGYNRNGNESGSGQTGYTGVVSNTTFTRTAGGGIGLKGTSVGSPGSGDGRGSYGGQDGNGWNTLRGGSYGGGGGTGTESNASTGQGSNGPGGSAGLRIIWGSGRSYPSNADDAFGDPDPVATGLLTIELAEDLSINEGTETLVINVDDTTVKTVTINDTSVTKEYSLDSQFETINKTETNTGITSTTVTMSRTYNVGELEVPLTWSGSDSRFTNNINKTVTFADGNSSASFTVSHVNNTEFAGNVTGTYTLGEVTGWTRVAPYILTYNLTEDDAGEQTVTMQIPADADYYTVANGENLLTTCTSMTLSSSSYKLYKINQNGSVTLLDSLSVSHPNNITGTLRRGIFTGGQYYGSYQTLSSFSGTRSLTRSLADHVIADNYYGSIGLFYALVSGGEMLAVSAGVQISGRGTSSPSLLYRFGRSIYIAASANRTYNRTVPPGFTAGISGINESAGRFGAYWPNGGNGAMYFTSATAFSVSSDGYQSNYYQDTPADRDGTDTGQNLTNRQSTSFIWSPDAAIEQ